MAIREPQRPDELSIGTDLDVKKNRPFRIVDRWTTGEHLIFLALCGVFLLVLAYFFWPMR